MMPSLHEVCVTGYGLLSSLPEDPELQWQALNHFNPDQSTVDKTTFAPFAVHPLIAFNAEKQILSHRDRRTLGETMQTAVYTAGQALDHAQLKNQPELLKDTQIIVALRGGERDEAADCAINEICKRLPEDQEKLNHGLMNQLRPTLFLSQLPNLLAANIALLFGLSGSSLTFMGAEMAGAQALELAYSRIQSGQAKRVLVGGVSFNQINEVMMSFAYAKKLATGFSSVWERPQGGLCLGSGSGFLVLEAPEAAKARGVPVLGKLSQALLGLDMQKNWQTALAQRADDALAILSMTSGDAILMNQERVLLQQLQNNHAVTVRAGATVVGSLLEAAIPVGLVLALQCLEKKKLFAPLDNTEMELPQEKSLTKIWLNAAGHIQGHALFCVEAA